MAGDSKIWIAALFMLISFVFNAIKKKRKAEKEALEGQQEEVQNSDASWGVGDLISQFEEKYGVETEAKQNEFVTGDMEVKEDYVSEYTAEEVDKQSYEGYSEESASHSGITRDKNVKLSDDVSYQTDSASEDSELELDLRQMVISSTILDRPQY